MLKLRRSLGASVAVAACAVAVTGCGSSSSSSSSKSTSASASGSASSAASSANVAGARAVLHEYSSPTPFPVDQPLIKRPVAGQKLAYLDCDVPTCALLVPLYDLAAKTMGIAPPVVVKAAGNSASDVQAAMSSILTQRPSALLLPAVNLGELGGSLPQYRAAKVPIVGAGVMGGPAIGITAPVNGPANFRLLGKILADWAITQKGDKANIVWYDNPELDFTKVETGAFAAEMAKNCPSCKVRYVNIPVAATGSTAPSTVVSDLQSHPGTNIALFANLEIALGLPAALKTAGISGIKIAGASPLPANLQDMKDGAIDAAVALDFGVLTFTQIDAAARLATHQPLTADEAAGYIPDQLITKANLTRNFSQGYAVYPDFVQRFAKLWAGAR